MRKIIFQACLLIMISTLSFAQEMVYQNETLRAVDFSSFLICMIETRPDSQRPTDAHVEVSCNGRKIAGIFARRSSPSYITGAQQSAQILLEKGFKLSGVGEGGVMIFTKDPERAR